MSDSNVGAVAEIVKNFAHKPELFTLPADPSIGAPAISIMAVPDGRGGFEMKTLQPYFNGLAAHPRQKMFSFRARAFDSFVQLIERFKQANSVVMFNDEYDDYEFTAIMDHFAPGDGPSANCQQIIRYGLEYRPTYDAWQNYSGDNCGQSTMLGRLTTRAKSIVDPLTLNQDDALGQFLKGRVASGDRIGSASEVLAAVETIKLVREVTVEETTTTDSQANSSESISVKTSGGEDAPNLFVIETEVYVPGKLYRVPVELRYHLYCGKVYWVYSLLNRDEIQAKAVADLIASVETDTGLPVFRVVT